MNPSDFNLLGVTVSFVLSEDAAGATVTGTLRLLGSVTGAIYGYLVVYLASFGQVSSAIHIRSYSILSYYI